MSFVQRMQDKRNDLSKSLEDNPKSISQGPGVVRVLYATNKDPNDPTNEPCMVFTHDLSRELSIDEIVSMIDERRTEKNMAISLTMNQLTQYAQSDKVDLVNDVVGALMSFETTLDTFKKNVIGNYNTHLSMLTQHFYERGVSFDFIHNHRNQLIEMARTALLVNMDYDGKSPLTTSKHIADNMLSKQGQRKIFQASPEFRDTINKLNNDLNRSRETSLSM